MEANNQSQPRRLSGFGANNAQSQQQQQSAGPGVLPPPPPPGTFFSPGQQPAHNLPAIAGITQPSPPQPSQRVPGQTQDGSAGQAGGYPLPGISQAVHHQQAQSAYDRERQMHDEAAMREYDERERDRRERTQDQPHMQTHAGSLHLHQPVAVGPQVRNIHGPNGLLANPGAMANANPLGASLGGPGGPGGLFGGGPVQQPDGTPRLGQAVPQQQTLMVPFAGTAGVQQAANLGVTQGQQPILNDALSYLDQVKVQFVDHPDVYNRFLDIMKDFKGGVIDTPGVIERVSSLFAGNPSLIQGFNTFLPPGYRIECGTSDDPNAIRVTTPMGTTVSSMASRPLSNPRSLANNAVGAGSERLFYEPRPRATSGERPPLFTIGGGSHPPGLVSPVEQRARQVAATSAVTHQQEQQGIAQLQNVQADQARLPMHQQSPPGPVPTPLAAHMMNVNGLAAQHVMAAGEKRGPVEFNHAISYVNKIKNRFSSQPDIYKQFLEILQTYQRESKPIQDVYAQVTTLFSAAPDLLEDFKQFLPESAAQAKAAQGRQDEALTSHVRGEPGYAISGLQQHTPRADQRLPPVGNFAPTPSANKDNKRKRVDRQGTVASNMPSAAQDSVAGPSGSKTNLPQNSNLNKRPKHGHQDKKSAPPEMPPVSPTLTPALPEPIPPTSPAISTTDGLSFFDRVRKFIGNKNTLNEFLKLCNLFNQDLIEKNVLVHRAQNFIGGNPELMKWFKDFLGYVEKDEVVQNIARPVSGRVALSNCRGLGPSYRLLPKRERLKKCSGRDELCHAVLNDEWASHPTWASEDSGFVAHRKNQYEEGLHRIEEERHDYDHNIEACQRTIQLLEPLAQQLRLMPEEERRHWTLPPGIGGQSEAIYQRIIMKVYGREPGRRVIESLHIMPNNVIPVLLMRLKSKLEEWKAAQREWEKVWREQTQKMFWKSLDHQSINVRSMDKRQYQMKTLQNEIQVRYEEQKRQREIPWSTVPKWQFKYDFKDQDVILDACYLTLAYADTNHAADYLRLSTFIKDFIPLFFGLDPELLEQRTKAGSGHQSPMEHDGDEEMLDAEAPYSPRARRNNGRKTDTLLRGVLERGKNGRATRGADESLASGSRGSTPDAGSAAEDELPTGYDTPSGNAENGSVGTDRWMEHPALGNDFNQRNVLPNEPFRRDRYNMYCNLPIYCFFRTFVTFYERLANLKNAEASVHEIVRRAKALKPAIELRMIDKMPSEYFNDTSVNANYYSQLLVMFEDVIKGDLETTAVEETLRRYYLQTGWQLYSFDKLIGALTRFGIGILNNDGKDKSWETIQLFKRDRVREETTHQDELNYRRQVEKYSKDGDTYRITFIKPTMSALIQILKRDEPTFDGENLSPEAKWSIYISSYTSVENTENVLVVENLPVLKRTLPEPHDAMSTPSEIELQAGSRFETVKSDENLNLRICVSNYRIVFMPNHYEWFVLESAANDELQPGHGRATHEQFSQATLDHWTESGEPTQEEFKMSSDDARNILEDEEVGFNHQAHQTVDDDVHMEA